MKPFTYEREGRVMTMSYYQVPATILEKRHEALLWATQAIQIAVKKKKLTA